jgi:hypothetical protein
MQRRVAMSRTLFSDAVNLWYVDKIGWQMVAIWWEGHIRVNPPTTPGATKWVALLEEIIDGL